MKTTYEKVLAFTNVSKQVRGLSKAPQTKFHYAIDKMRSNISSACKKIEKAYTEKDMELQIKYASVDEKNNLVLQDNGSYSFSKDNWGKYQEELSRLLDEKSKEVVEVEPYMAAHIPDNLSMYEAETFAGFILPENYEIAIAEN